MSAGFPEPGGFPQGLSWSWEMDFTAARTHHQIKQLPGWTLHQISPGVFQWTTPGGRTYTTTPDTHPV